MTDNEVPQAPKPSDFTTYNDYIGNWNAWYNTMKGMGIL